jgi:hypothetical protein
MFVLPIGRNGYVDAENFHPIPIFREMRLGEAYLIYEECAFLATLPDGLTMSQSHLSAPKFSGAGRFLGAQPTD